MELLVVQVRHQKFNFSRVNLDAICSDSFLVLPDPFEYCYPLFITTLVNIFLCAGPLVKTNSYSGLI